MTLVWAALAAAAGYLSGSVSFARLMARGRNLAVTRFDSGEGASMDYEGISATSVMVRKGPLYGCATSLLDMAKAAVPVLAFRLAFPDDHYYLVAAVAAVAGHDFPIFHRMKGGRGLSPIYGGLLIIDWLAIPVTAAGGALVASAFRDMYIAYVAGVPLLIPWMAWRNGISPELAYAVAVNVVFWLSVTPEIRNWISYRRQVGWGSWRFEMTKTHVALLKARRRGRSPRDRPPDR